MHKKILIFLGITTIIIWSRFIGINWDSATHLNPDERFLTMVSTSLNWPNSIKQYFDTNSSPLNPHNKGHSFYVYGTWPVIFIKFIAQTINKDSYDQIVNVGRIVSGTADILTSIFIFLLALRLTKSINTAIFAQGFYGLMVLPIQQAHFFTVDSLLTLFITIFLFSLSFTPGVLTGMITGIIMGISIATKISALPIILPFFISTGLFLLKSKKKYANIYLFFAIYSFFLLCFQNINAIFFC